MQIYLPIAEISIGIHVLIAMGFIVGFLSGMLGVGGGFLMTPLLIFTGIPPGIAIATEANQILASSISGGLAHWKKRTIDIKMGIVLLIGGCLGALLGIKLFSFLVKIGQLDLIISLCYTCLLGFIGTLMLYESLNTIFNNTKKKPSLRRTKKHTWLHHLPFKIVFSDKASLVYQNTWTIVKLPYLVR